MDPQSTTNKNPVNEMLDEMIEAAGLDEEQKNQVFSQLEKAVVAKTLTTLFSRLSPEEMQALNEKPPETGEQLLQSFSNKISKEEMQDILSESAASVLESFVEKI